MKCVENLFPSHVVDILSFKKLLEILTVVKTQVRCNFSKNNFLLLFAQSSVLITYFQFYSDSNCVSKEITNFWPLVSNINPFFNWKTSNSHQDYLVTFLPMANLENYINKVLVLTTATVTAVAMICAGSKSSA